MNEFKIENARLDLVQFHAAEVRPELEHPGDWRVDLVDAKAAVRARVLADNPGMSGAGFDRFYEVAAHLDGEELIFEVEEREI